MPRLFLRDDDLRDDDLGPDDRLAVLELADRLTVGRFALTPCAGPRSVALLLDQPTLDAQKALPARRLERA